MAYPTDLDIITPDPLPGSSRMGHAALHTLINGAIRAIQAKMGITNSAVTTSFDYRIRTLEAGGVGGSGSWIERDVIITPAEILNCFSVPVTLIPAPGAGQAIIVQSVMLSMSYNTTAYVGNIFATIRYSGGSNNIATSNVLGAVTSAIGFHNNIFQFASINESVVFQTDTGNPSAGDSILKCKIWYKVITI